MWHAGSGIWEKVPAKLGLISTGMKPFISHFHLSQLHLTIPPLWNCCLMSDDFCICMRIPEECHLNCLIIKTCSLLPTVRSVLRELIESISNKTSPPVFPSLNTQRGSSVMQFPRTQCPLTGAPFFPVCAAALLQHQHYDEVEGGATAPCLNLVIDLSGHLHWLVIICS